MGDRVFGLGEQHEVLQTETGYGFKACFEFFELAFSYTFGPGEAGVKSLL